MGVQLSKCVCWKNDRRSSNTLYYCRKRNWKRNSNTQRGRRSDVTSQDESAELLYHRLHFPTTSSSEIITSIDSNNDDVNCIKMDNEVLYVVPDKEVEARKDFQAAMEIQICFVELLDLVSDIDIKGYYRTRKEDKEINWDTIIETILSLDSTIAEEVMKCQDGYQKKNILMWILWMNGKPPTKLVQIILEISSSEVLDQKDYLGYNFLHFARSSSLEIIQLLLTNAAANDKPNAMLLEKEIYGNTPLHCIMYDNDTFILKEVIKFIVKSNPEILTIQNKNGETPLQLAIENKKSIDIIVCLLSEDCSNEILSKVAQQKNNHGNTNLHIVIQKDSSLDIVRLLLKSIPKATEVKNNQGDTPLHFALKYNNDGNNISIEMIRLLVEANPSALLLKDSDGRLPLHLAIRLRRHESLVREIVQMIVELQPVGTLVRDKKGRTPSQYAVQLKKSYEIINCLSDGNTFPLLEASAAAIRKDNDDGNTTLHYAMKYKSSIHAIQAILNVNPNIVIEKNNDGDTPLHTAIKCNNDDLSLEIITLVIEANPKVTFTQDNEGNIPLLSAMMMMNNDVSNNKVLHYLSECIIQIIKEII